MGLAVAHFCWQRMQLDERLDMFINHWSDPFQNGKKTYGPESYQSHGIHVLPTFG